MTAGRISANIHLIRICLVFFLLVAKLEQLTDISLGNLLFHFRFHIYQLCFRPKLLCFYPL